MPTLTARSALFAVSLFAFSPFSRADEATDTKMAEDQMALLEKLVDVAVEGKGNCDKMATDMGHFVDVNAARIKAIKEWSSKLTAEQKKAIEEKYAARTKAAVERMAPAIGACGKNKGVQEALKRLAK